ncbi:hypothetical protein NE237_014559 [Protea cynaroides]|uniref:Uncharacterized protein n=1 Tax=Protea cynaroides TaxID=273540 RepID=A0A9Q0QQ85_9MAGN|nr:hypothetical protein NE237_014559 [Protea cynaroides]
MRAGKVVFAGLVARWMSDYGLRRLLVRESSDVSMRGEDGSGLGSWRWRLAGSVAASIGEGLRGGYGEMGGLSLGKKDREQLSNNNLIRFGHALNRIEKVPRPSLVFGDGGGSSSRVNVERGSGQVTMEFDDVQAVDEAMLEDDGGFIQVGKRGQGKSFGRGRASVVASNRVTRQESSHQKVT